MATTFLQKNKEENKCTSASRCHCLKTKYYINKVQYYQSETHSKSQVYKISPIQQQF